MPIFGKEFNTFEDLFEGEVPVHKAGYYTDLLADRAVEYITAHEKTAPFFLSLHFTAPHWPWEGPDDEATSREIKSIFHYDGGTKYSAYTGTGGPGQVAGYIEPSAGLEKYYGVLPGK